MAEEGFKRKLTAILSADVIGYSRLMRDDEEATVRDLAAHRVLINEIIQQHNGRVVDSPGDNLLAEFASVVDAVNGAIKIQAEIKKSNTGVPAERHMEFRIGINLGDVIEEEERIYGDGVNIAARVEGLAAGGGIAISGTVYEHIKEKLSLGYHYLGEQEVKNISEPVRVYRLLTEPADAGKLIGGEKPKSKKLRWAATGAITLIAIVVGAFAIWNYYFRPSFEPASVEKMAFPLPEKPSIAVLPFDNMSGDPEQDYIADGISENIISDLSKISEMFVIARNSTFTYKGKPVKVQQVSEELGVRYVLEGSTQKIGERLRITAQLIDATTGHHLWSEKYDRNMKDFFALQDEITQKIIVELQVKLTEGEQARISHKSTTNLEAWSYAVRGLKLFERSSKENNAKAMEFFKKAVELDPGYVWAWVRLGWTYIVAGKPGWSESPNESIKMAEEIAKKAITLDESDSDVHALLGLVYLLRGQWEKAIAEGEKSIKLGPTNAQAHVQLAVSMYNVGRFDNSIKLVKKAMRLHPYYPAYYLQWVAGAYRMTGRYEEALKVYKQLLRRSQNGEFPVLDAHLFLADVYAELGKYEEARTHAKEVLSRSPEFSLNKINQVRTFRFKNPDLLERRLSALRRAGIPSHPPLKLPDKPSIAVLPFDNMSKDPEQEYFADGMTDDLITDLSKISGLFVIARNSTFQYKGKAVDVKEVSRELGIRYVLEGSVRKAGDQVRINAQLIDATTGGHLWAERYDGPMDEIFSLQDKITQKIVEALAVNLTIDEREAIPKRETDNLEAYLTFLKGWQSYRRFTPTEISKAITFFEKATILDPNFSRAYASLARIYMELYQRANYRQQLGINRDVAINRTHENLKKAMNPPNSLAYAVSAELSWSQGDFDRAVTDAKKAVSLDPNDPESHQAMGIALMGSGMHSEAVNSFKLAMRLDPFQEATFGYLLGMAYFHMSQFKKTVNLCEKSLKNNPENPAPLWYLAAAQAHIGNKQGAAAALAKLRELESYSRLNYLPYIFKFKNSEDFNLLADGLRKAGMK
jgi:adenylate cyclase